MRKLLLILGAPLWIPIAIAAFAVVLSLFLSLWAVLLSAAAIAVYGAVYGTALLALGHLPQGLALLGAGITSVGLTLLLWLACRAASRAMLRPMQRRCYRV